MRGTVAALALLLAGCGFMQVGERPIPPVPGAVAATAWQHADPGTPELGDTTALTTPEAHLDALAAWVATNQPPNAGQPPNRGVQHGILSQSGGDAVGYFQTLRPTSREEVLAFEARLTLARQADGSWALDGAEWREVCAEPLTDGACGDTSGGAGEPLPVPTDPVGETEAPVLQPSAP